MNSQSTSKFAPFILRLVVGLSFLLHGLPKLTNASMTANFFAKMGIPFPLFMVIVVGLIEVIGGLSFLIGWGTRVFGALLAIDMLVAILLVKAGAGYVGGFELELLLLAGAASILLSGPGAWALSKQPKTT